MKDEDLLLNRKTNFPEIMSIAEAAAYLTISKYFLYTLVKRRLCALCKDW